MPDQSSRDDDDVDPIRYCVLSVLGFMESLFSSVTQKEQKKWRLNHEREKGERFRSLVKVLLVSSGVLVLVLAGEPWGVGPANNHL